MKALAAHFRSANVRVWTYTAPKSANATVRYVAHRRLGTVAALLAEGRKARILDATHFHLEYPNPLLLPLWISLKRLLGFNGTRMFSMVLCLNAIRNSADCGGGCFIAR